MTEPTKPTVDMPFKEALDELTGFEIIGIQNHYGLDLERLGGIRSVVGAVWAYANRTTRTSWSTVESMTLNQLYGYFARPDEDPDGDQGKDSTQPEPRPVDSPNSASPRASRKSSTSR